MQTFDTYGFYVKSPGFENTERFFEIKSFIEEICKSAEKISKKYNKSKFCHFLPISKDISITCNIYNYKASFGLYNHNEKQLYFSTELIELKLFTDMHKDKLISRLEGAAKNNLNLSPIDLLWLNQKEGQMILNFSEKEKEKEIGENI